MCRTLRHTPRVLRDCTTPRNTSDTSDINTTIDGRRGRNARALRRAYTRERRMPCRHHMPDDFFAMMDE